LFELKEPGETGGRREMGVAAMEPTRKESMESSCTGMDSMVASLLLDPTTVPAKVQTHIAECDRCRQELDELRATMALLDSWAGPEPSPSFLPRLAARLEEERQAEQTGWLRSRIAWLRESFAYRPQPRVRPLVATALTVLLLAGGGVYWGISGRERPAATSGQATVVRDLQTMDNNAHLLDQLEALSSNN
jgi:anti-sigma factor RsiW